MTVPTWYVSFVGLCLVLTGASTDLDVTETKTSEDLSNGKASVFGFTCESMCGVTGKALRCELKANGECAKRYYVVCNGKDGCQWEMIMGSCEEEMSTQDVCNTGVKLRRRSETGVSYVRSVGLVPALRRRFSGVRRRDLGEQQPQSARSGMVMTSGNGHAYAMDNNNLVESHYGRPAVYSPRPESNLLGFPFSFISRLPNFDKHSYTSGSQPMPMSTPPVEKAEGRVIPQEPQPNPAAQPVNNWSGYQPVSYPSFATIGHYPSMYHQPNGYNQPYYPPGEDYSIWGNRGRAYSPFTSFFNAVGLQDPMLLLQYLPVG